MRTLLVSALLVLLAGALAAQNVIYNSSVRAFQTSVGPQTIVRDSKGYLYVIYRDQFTPPQNDLAIGRSTNGGVTWNMSWQVGFAGNTATDVGTLSPCIAIDGNDNLHCAWLHQMTSVNRPPRTIRYRRYVALTQTWDAEVTVTSAKFELNYPAIAVDSKNFIYFGHGTTSSSWKTVIDRSTTAYNDAGAFNPIAPAFSSNFSSQHPDIIIDALDRIHISYYENGSTGGTSVKHKWMDPAATSPTWTFTSLGNTNATADYYSSMAADLNGNVYIVYGVDGQAGKPEDPEWFIRKWDATTTSWGSAISFYKTTRVQWEPASGQHNDGRVISAGCDENTGEFYFVYRNVDTGDLLLARWRTGDAAPSTYATLGNTSPLPANSRNYFIYPQLRGSLNPISNRFSHGLDLLYTVGDQNATTPSYDLYYDPFPVGSVLSNDTPKIGTTYDIDLSGLQDQNGSYTLALAFTRTSGIPMDRRTVPLDPDNLFFLTAANQAPAIFQNFTATFDGQGTATAKFVIPSIPALDQLQIEAAFVTYPGGPVGIKTISNPFSFTLTL